MGLAVLKDVPDRDNGEAGQGAFLDDLVEGLLDGGLVLERDVGTDSVISELAVLGVCRVEDIGEGRFDKADDSGKLAGSAGLFLVKVVELYFRIDGFSVVDSGVTELDGDAVLSFDSLSVDF